MQPHTCIKGQTNLFVFALQDLMESDGITLDWMFRYSLINDIVKVTSCSRVLVGGATEDLPDDLHSL